MMIDGERAEQPVEQPAEPGEGMYGGGTAIDEERTDRPSEAQSHRFADCAAMLTYAQEHTRQMVAASPTGAPFPEPSPCAAHPACEIFPSRGEFAFPRPSWTPTAQSASEHGGLLKIRDGVAYFMSPRTLYQQPLDRSASELTRLPIPFGSALFVSGERALIVTPWGAETRLLDVDISDPSRMEIVRTRSIAAEMVGVVEVEEHVRLVLQSRPSIAWEIAGSGGALGSVASSDPEQVATARAHNRVLIDEANAADWLPTYEESEGSESLPLLDCAAMARPQHGAGMSVTLLVDIDVAEGLDHWTAHGLFAEAAHVFGSHRQLWVATTPWRQLSDQWLLPEHDEPGASASHLHLYGAPAEGFPQLGMATIAGRVIDVAELTDPPGAHVLSEMVDDILRDANETFGRPSTDSHDATVSFVARVDGSLRVEGRTDAFSAQRPSGMARSGDRLLIPSRRNEVRTEVVDISDRRNPVKGGAVDLYGPWLKFMPVADGRLIAVGRAVDAAWNYDEAESYLKVLSGDQVLRSFDLGRFHPDVSDPSLFHYEPSTQSLVTCGRSSSGSRVVGIDCIAFDVSEDSPRNLGQIEHAYHGPVNSGYRWIRGARIVDRELVTFSYEELRVTDLNTMETRLHIDLMQN